MDLIRHIKGLIAQYDYVIIPDFGGFVSNYQPAKIHSLEHSISPPSKSIAFNKNLTSDDGLLVNFVAKKERISISEATQKVSEFTRRCKESLYNKEIIMLPSLGKLFLDIENKIQFIPDHTKNHLLQAYGLPPVEGFTILRSEIFNTNIDLEDEDELSKRKPRKTGIWYYAAALVLLLIISASSFYFLEKDVRMQTCSMITNIFEKKPSEKIAPLTEVETIKESDLVPKINTDQFYEQEIVEENIDEEKPAEAEPRKKPVRKIEEPATTVENEEIPKGYFVVIGSFTKERNVSRLFQKLKDNNQTSYKIPNNKGFMRIGIFISQDLTEATRQLDSLRRVYNDQAWILKNN